MVTDRLLNLTDYPLLKTSLQDDSNHQDTTPEFFSQPGTLTKVYEDDQGPVMFVRAAKSLRLDIQYVSNADVKRNMKAMLVGFDILAKRAKDNGFTEVCFQSNSPFLKAFCIKRFGFVESQGELRKNLL
jgi:hypothetical protein